MSEHSILSPSAAKRWGHCTRSVLDILEHDIKESTSEAAELGTRAHAYAEQVLKSNWTAAKVPEDFAHIKVYTDFCETLGLLNSDYAVEHRVPLYYLQQDGGTTDYINLDHKAVHIVDYKNGVREKVFAEANPQLAIYALSAIEEANKGILYNYGPDTEVSMTVVMPLCFGVPPVQTWTVTVAELKTFLVPYTDAADLILKALAGDATAIPLLTYAPSYDACRWCPMAKLGCKAKAEYALSQAQLSLFEVVDLVDDTAKTEARYQSKVLTDKQRYALFVGQRLIVSLIEDNNDQMLAMAVAGTPVFGTKLVRANPGKRQWIDEQVAADALTMDAKLPMEDVFVTKLKSPAQVEKMGYKDTDLIKKLVDSLSVASQGGVTLALIKDKRPELEGALTLFKSEDNHASDPRH